MVVGPVGTLLAPCRIQVLDTQENSLLDTAIPETNPFLQTSARLHEMLAGNPEDGALKCLFEHFTSDESEDNRIAMVDRLPPPSHPHPHTTSHSPPSYHLTSPFTLHTPRPPQQSEASQRVEKKGGAKRPLLVFFILLGRAWGVMGGSVA